MRRNGARDSGWLRGVRQGLKNHRLRSDRWRFLFWRISEGGKGGDVPFCMMNGEEHRSLKPRLFGPREREWGTSSVWWLVDDFCRKEKKSRKSATTALQSSARSRVQSWWCWASAGSAWTLKTDDKKFASIDCRPLSQKILKSIPVQNWWWIDSQIITKWNLFFKYIPRPTHALDHQYHNQPTVIRDVYIHNWKV